MQAMSTGSGGLSQAVQGVKHCWPWGGHQALSTDGEAHLPVDEIEGLDAEPPGPAVGCLAAALNKLAGGPSTCTLPSCFWPSLSARGWGAIAMGVAGGLMVQLELFGSPFNHPAPATIAEHTLLGMAVGAGVGFGLGWLRELMLLPPEPTV